MVEGSGVGGWDRVPPSKNERSLSMYIDLALIFSGALMFMAVKCKRDAKRL